MVISFCESGPHLSDADIAMLEKEIKVSLPHEYREFLLRKNGGRPVPSAFPIDGFENNPFGVIQVFFRISGNVETSNIAWNFETMNGRLPDNLIAIACTGSGDLICLSLYGEDAGAVLFWDFYNEPPEPSYANVYRIADSFEEFLDRIQELPE